MAKEMIVEKEILIAKNIREVYDYLKYCRNQENFSVWNMADPNKKVTVSGTDAQTGFVYAWDSTNKNVGAGSQTISSMVENKEIVFNLKFERPMKNTGVSAFRLEATGENATRVIWDFRGPTKFPMSLFKGIFQKMLGKDIDRSLMNLKQILEK